MTILLKVAVLATVLLSGYTITPSRPSLAMNKTIDLDKQPLDGCSDRIPNGLDSIAQPVKTCS